jgi:hypothetical protein
VGGSKQRANCLGVAGANATAAIACVVLLEAPQPTPNGRANHLRVTGADATAAAQAELLVMTNKLQVGGVGYHLTARIGQHCQHTFATLPSALAVDSEMWMHDGVLALCLQAVAPHAWHRRNLRRPFL